MKKIAIGILSICALCGFKGLLGNSTQEVSAYSMEKCASVQTTSSLENVRDCDNLKLRAKSAYVMDFSSNTKIYSNNELQRLPIASMCKIMTLLLSFEAIDNGVLGMDEEIIISERAASMGGSQVFLEANAKYPVRELLKSIVVCSANDSCVALAEKIAGSEDVFVDRMNEKAKELGGAVLITADRGNADVMLAKDGTPFTAHSTNPVPFIVYNYPCELREHGVLADIAPTMLKMLNIEKPESMTGESIVL
jgi:hypothetical protein